MHKYMCFVFLNEIIKVLKDINLYCINGQLTRTDIKTLNKIVLNANLYSNLIYSVLFYYIQFYSIPFYSILIHFMLFYSIEAYFNTVLIVNFASSCIVCNVTIFLGTNKNILVYSVLHVFYSILFYSILFYSILCHSILFHSVLFYFIEAHSDHSYCTYGEQFSKSRFNFRIYFELYQSVTKIMRYNHYLG